MSLRVLLELRIREKNIIIIIILAAVIISLLSVVFIYYKKVENSLKDNSVVAKGRNVDYKALDDDVDYNDEKYIYNDNIVNILVLGVDSDLPVTQKQEKIGDMGQTDAIYLVSIDTKKHSLQVYAIPRDSMCEVDIYNESGKLVSLMDAQLACNIISPWIVRIRRDYQRKPYQG